jgi:HEAT repeat protein
MNAMPRVFGRQNGNLLPPSRPSLAIRQLLPALMVLLACAGCMRTAQPNRYQGRSLRHWENMALDKDPANRRAAAEALGHIGPKGLPSLLKLRDDRNFRVRTAAMLACDRMGAAAIPELKQLIHDPEPSVRARAMKLLASTLVDQGPRGVPPLIELLSDPEPNVRADAATALAVADRATATRAIPVLKELQRDGHPAVRKSATLTLRTLEPPKYTSPFARPRPQ